VSDPAHQIGVSKTILGTAESDTNRATAETADYVFSKRTIKPKMELVLSYLNEFLVPRYGDLAKRLKELGVKQESSFAWTAMSHMPH
jgi:hypothetical protein